MGLFAKFFDWQDDVGYGVGNVAQQIGKSVLNGACSIYTKYPKAIFWKSAFTGVMRSYCKAIDAPVPPFPNGFPGGQCSGVNYRVYGYYYNANQDHGPCGGLIAWESTNVLKGPIWKVAPDPSGSTLRVYSKFPGQPLSSIRWIGATSSGVMVETQCYDVDSPYSARAAFLNGYYITHCVRQDGQPDVCGLSLIHISEPTRLWRIS